MIIYLAAVGVVTLLLVLRIAWWLRMTERRNLRIIRRQANAQPVTTSSPLDDPTASAKTHATEAIANRFSVTRRLVLPLILVLGGLAASLPFLDMVPAASVSVLVGAVTVIAGLALRPVVENAIAGLVLSGSKLVSVGDTLSISGHYGTVEDITATHTTIKLWDWKRYIVANSQMLQIEFINHSLFDNYEWAYIEFWVDYSADLDEVERLVVEAAESSTAYVDYEKPRMWLIETGPDAVLCWGAGWADSPSKAWRLRHDMRKSLVPALSARGWAPRRYRLEGHKGSALGKQAQS